MIRIALETNRKEDSAIILEDLKKRNIWEHLNLSLQTELNYSANKVLDEIVPEGIRFTEKFDKLLKTKEFSPTKDENINIIFLILHHVAKSIVEGKKEEEIFLRLKDVGINANLILQIIEPFYNRVISSLSKQKPNPMSYIYALFAGFLSTIIGGVGYGYFMINTNSKHSFVLILLGALSGILIHVLAGGKKGTGMICIGASSTVLAIFLGNVIFALNKSVALPLTKFDFIWGVVGLACVVGLLRMTKTSGL